MTRSTTIWLAVALYTALIAAISSIPAQRMPPVPIWDYDKLIHAGEYALLAGLWLLAVRTTPAAGRTLLCLSIAVVVASATGALDELYQGTVPGRHSSVFDWLADTLGGLLGATVLTFWIAHREDRRGSDQKLR